MGLRSISSSLKFGLAAAVLLVLVSGCATPPQTEGKAVAVMNDEVYDPLEPMNRYFFDVNYALDALFLKPVAEMYRGVVPTPVRDSVTNFLTNLSQPIYLINNVLQGELNRAGDNMGAFFTNTFLGVGGLFDVAKLNTQPEDMGQTFAVWGISEGPYLVVPVLGPRTTRAAVGGVADYYLDPINYAARENDMDNVGIIRAAATGLDQRSRSLGALDEIERTSIDFYAAIRSLYRQNRNNLIHNGASNSTQLPSMNFDDDDENMAKKN
ncbi:VacJ family lipoprotein [uncultured Sneathiella sp.]|jgi:phospholipid-binding lipoprotein MlaA|uniref:MlaA family lipoprotein n=1 Tax=uncultured Sneathiella sp. TaxID=879315 RepID=UPI0030DB5612|tara:strand:- start:78 stop:878 length:801 start_codon:yes stop_codon:yes gene_type:complete